MERDRLLPWLSGGCGLIVACLGAYQLHTSQWAAERGASNKRAAELAEQLEVGRTRAGEPPVTAAVEQRLARLEAPEPGSNHAIAEERLEGILAEAAEATGLDRDLIRAVVRTESDFRPGAVSSAGAVGLMQVRPVAATDVGARVPEWAERVQQREDLEIEARDLTDPRLNIMLGSHYLAELRERYAGYAEPVATWLALAAYNWGPSNVARHLLAEPGVETLEDLRWRLQRRAPYETRAFIQRVLERSGRYPEAARQATSEAQ